MTVELQISDSGKIARLLHTNGRIIAEFLVHGPLKKVVDNCERESPIVSGRANVYRGELFGLAGYEYLNIDEERLEER